MNLSLAFIDYLLIGLYFVFVLGIGFKLKRQMVTSEDFFLAGHKIPTWVTGLAFLSANLGAIEVMGMAGNAAKYGMVICHFYWIGAIPAMIFLALFMMPFYYDSKVKSVPEYLQKRFNEPTRAFNAVSFAIMTILMSGINMYAMALVFQLLLGWDMNLSIFLSAFVVLAYTFMGGLTSSMYNEVMQFFLIVFGLLPIALLGLIKFGGWEMMSQEFQNLGYAHVWMGMGTTQNKIGVDWIGLLSGLGFVLSFGYWCTDFLVIQRALAARDTRAAQRTPLIAAFPKVFFPMITVLPGLIALLVFPEIGKPGNMAYDMALPSLIGVMYPNGMLGIGITALLASFMSGMAGNVTAFNTVWTYDIYQSYIAPNKSDRHYLWMGRVATAAGILASIGAAYLVIAYGATIMDYMQLVFTFFNAPLFATFALGMFWARCTPWGAFIGLVCGTAAAVGHYFLSEAISIHVDLLPPYLMPLEPLWHDLRFWLSYKTEMAGNFWRAVFAWMVCFAVTVIVSLVTKPRNKEELVGLVWGLSKEKKKSPDSEPWYVNPVFLSVILILITIVLNLMFW